MWEFFQVENDSIKSYQEHSELNPLTYSESLRNKMIRGAFGQKIAIYL